MMRAQLLQVLESPPGFIKGLPILLNKGGDIGPQFRSLVQWEVFAKARFGENFPCGEGVGPFFCKQSLALSLKENKKSLSQIASVEAAFSLIVSHLATKL